MVFIHAIAGSNPAATTIFVAQKFQKEGSDFSVRIPPRLPSNEKEVACDLFFIWGGREGITHPAATTIFYD